jgi:hypothetical protein
MSQRFDVLSAREYKARDGEKKTAWTNVGVAFESKNKDGFDVTLHCVPVPVDGVIRLVCRVPKERDDSGGGQYGGSSGVPF